MSTWSGTAGPFCAEKLRMTACIACCACRSGRVAMIRASAPRPAESLGTEEALAQLRAMRGTIDNLDAALVHLLAERFRCTQQVGLLKAQLDLPPADPGREQHQVARLRALAEESGLDPIFAEKFFTFIVAEGIQHHEEIRDGHEAELAR